jgi:Ca-activated chloride channel family protein
VIVNQGQDLNQDQQGKIQQGKIQQGKIQQGKIQQGKIQQGKTMRRNDPDLLDSTPRGIQYPARSLTPRTIALLGGLMVSGAMVSGAIVTGGSAAASPGPVFAPQATVSPIATMPSPPTQRLSNPATSDRPQAGLYTTGDRPERFVLEHTEVNAAIAGNLNRVTVEQTFTNPFTEPLEAVYVFPLPDEAAVDEMEIQIGDRVIKGDIKHRDEAREIYDEARREGRTAGLLEQERPNIFTQSLANIRPGETIQVRIRYSELLPYEAGQYEMVFPMVVGPRYIPGTPTTPDGDTDRVPDASRINPPVLPPGLRSGQDIQVTVNLDAGVPVGEILSSSHDIEVVRDEVVRDRPSSRATIRLAPGDQIPNKDLILRYQVAGEATQTSLLTQADERGGHFALSLLPAIDYPAAAIVPKDVVFLIDTSGSQQGAPIAQSQALMRRFLDTLNPDDTFAIIDFANTAQRLSDRPLANTAANRRRALAYVNNLSANGGTNLDQGINAVLNFPAAAQERLRSVVLLTDGYIGNDTEIIGTVRSRLPEGTRLYSFGVGSSVNRFLIDRLAEVGRGLARVVRPDDPVEPVIADFLTRINNPVLTRIQLRWEGSGAAPELYPQPLPDLFTAQPLQVFGRKGDRAPGTLIVTGVAAGGQPFEQRVPVTFDRAGNPAIAHLWGRQRIKSLMTEMAGDEVQSLVDAITTTALDYRLLSQYTAFVAVSEEVRVDPDGSSRRVEVPVEIPDGVSYEGIFGNAGEITLDGGGLAVAPPPGVPIPRSGVLPPTRSSLDGSTRGGNLTIQATGDIDRPAPLPAPPDRITVVTAPGLDAAAIADLEEHLNYVRLPEGVSGRMAMNVVIENGRVTRVIFADQVSSVTDPAVVRLVRQALLSWRSPTSNAGTGDRRQVQVTLDLLAASPN